MKHKYQRLGFFHQKLDWPIDKVKFGDYKISRKVVVLVKNLPQQDDMAQANYGIHNCYLDLKKQLIEFKNKKDCYYYEHTNAIQECLDAIYLLGNCQFFISEFSNQQNKMQLVKINDDYLLETLYLYFEIRRSESKEKDSKLVQELEQANYNVSHKIGILSCNLHGLEKLAEVNLIIALKQEQNEKQLINIIQMLKYLYTKSPAQFSCDEDLKKEILTIINSKYNVLPESVKKFRDDFDVNAHAPSYLKHNSACAIF